MPTAEQIQTFTRHFDGEMAPDSIPFPIKLRDAISDYESLERLKLVFTTADGELLESFRASMPAADIEDAQLLNTIYGELCKRIDELTAEEAAAEIKRMDNVLLERQEERARKFVRSLSPDAARGIELEAERLGRTIKGVDTDITAMAEKHPDYVKERIKKICKRRLAK